MKAVKRLFDSYCDFTAKAHILELFTSHCLSIIIVNEYSISVTNSVFYSEVKDFELNRSLDSTYSSPVQK